VNERGACSLGPSEVPVGAFSKEFKRPIEEPLWDRCAGSSNCSSDTSIQCAGHPRGKPGHHEKKYDGRANLGAPVIISNFSLSNPTPSSPDPAGTACAAAAGLSAPLPHSQWPALPAASPSARRRLGDCRSGLPQCASVVPPACAARGSRRSCSAPPRRTPFLTVMSSVKVTPRPWLSRLLRAD